MKKIKTKGISKGIFIGIILMIISITFPFILKIPAPFKFLDFNGFGELGSAIDGLTAPIIGIAGIILTFAAFWVQYQANVSQRESINTINKATYIDNFNMRLKSMLEQHSRNIQDISVTLFHDDANIKGIQIQGIYVFEYFKAFMYSCFKYLEPLKNYSNQEKTIFSYLFLYLGLTKKMFVTEIKDFDIPDDIYEIFEKKLSEYGFSFNGNYLKTTVRKNDFFNGYEKILSKYFRFLIQILEFVDSFNPPEALGIDEEEIEIIKQNAGNLLRSYINGDEQLILFYSALSPLGSSLISKKYILKYKLINNIYIFSSKGANPVDWAKKQKALSTEDEKASFDDFFEFYDI